MRILSKTEAIVPGISIGGICLGNDAAEVVGELMGFGAVVSRYRFENLGQRFSEWTVNDWGLSFAEESSGKIVRICCTSGYEGKYDRIFYPGMSVRQVVSCSSKQLFIHGRIVINKEFGLFFDVPERFAGKMYDDVDSVSQLPGEMILERLNVMDRNWWR